MRISEIVAQAFVNALLASAPPAAPNISFELQDDGQFLLVDAKAPTHESQKRILAFLKNAQDIAAKTLPCRKGYYTWMVNVSKEGVVVESTFGGDLDSPDSGRV